MAGQAALMARQAEDAVRSKGLPLNGATKRVTSGPVEAAVEAGRSGLHTPGLHTPGLHTPGLHTPGLHGPELRIEYAQDEATRRVNTARLRAAAERVLREVPGSRLATDSAGRVTDIAVDHSEFAHLTPDQIAQVVAVMQAEGMHATVSSIHINAWFGEHDKLSGARWIVRRLYGRDLDAETAHWVYVGDSTNDQRMFGHFPLSIGVANLLHFAAALTTWPAYLAAGERGAGFAEIVQALLAARR
jgi:hypothetical protein